MSQHCHATMAVFCFHNKSFVIRPPFFPDHFHHLHTTPLSSLSGLSPCMEDPPLVRCPDCGSWWTEEREPDRWVCRYCHSTILVEVNDEDAYCSGFTPIRHEGAYMSSKVAALEREEIKGLRVRCRCGANTTLMKDKTLAL
jgi:DNA-directed RNA polymerase subunit RPC12/RpoP